MWKLMWNPMWSVCENMCELTWNSFAIQWGFTRESLCETPCEVYVKICVKGFTSFHTLFTYTSLCKISHACEICVWNSCEKCVKNKWKKCENCTGFFTYILLVVRERERVSNIFKPTSRKLPKAHRVPKATNWSKKCEAKVTEGKIYLFLSNLTLPYFLE